MDTPEARRRKATNGKQTDLQEGLTWIMKEERGKEPCIPTPTRGSPEARRRKGTNGKQTDTPEGFTRSMKEETDKEPLQPTPPSSCPKHE